MAARTAVSIPSRRNPRRCAKAWGNTVSRLRVLRSDPLIRPALVRRLILASSAPRGAAGMHGWAPDVIGAAGRPEANPEGYLDVFFAPSSSSRQASQEVLGAFTPGPKTGQADNLGHPRGAVRRGLHVGNPGSLAAAATERYRSAGIRGKRRQRPNDLAALFLPDRGLDPAGGGEDLPRLRARIPVSASHGVRRRGRGLLGQGGLARFRSGSTPCALPPEAGGLCRSRRQPVGSTARTARRSSLSGASGAKRVCIRVSGQTRRAPKRVGRRRG